MDASSFCLMGEGRALTLLCKTLSRVYIIAFWGTQTPDRKIWRCYLAACPISKSIRERGTGNNLQHFVPGEESWWALICKQSTHCGVWEGVTQRVREKNYSTSSLSSETNHVLQCKIHFFSQIRRQGHCLNGPAPQSSLTPHPEALLGCKSCRNAPLLCHTQKWGYHWLLVKGISVYSHNGEWNAETRIPAMMMSSVQH